MKFQEEEGPQTIHFALDWGKWLELIDALSAASD
jgi:hypothetical protein